ncbi:exopolysaccharide biosynthesis protein [Sulfitobacter geojensis]|uniref:Exopolysaccharide biosynthesis protein n=1 Tax=Sulfitobacter geojensis TaxID=1342299 RepID=A0AAE2VYE8_9RHOB|nr:exopolysaccharide biosynthesis protein [Sulfitobacter geojensis]MBM1689557.1 exopolysaccharide biosynthesis protein [Sulfitobacter geojensis]MBM1693623.1 exopolysaccharide biosynthesis protein [Sulfitobacter geojensis]MBM1705789.1 exopolysaccharide biosynthesis protein [Sulfitobacter geojensis]MBM1709847.1 exopolysaccharide biosynthesis protein [Sulfitobacter geojensis]MBM1713913.1 exopolysaccharide biosynthesis protein [Sulfitobacter geojensis]
MSDDPDNSLMQLLDGVAHAARGDVVTLSDMLDEFGNRAVTPFILLVSLLLVSPLSGIPGAPTTGAVVIIVLAAQALLGRGTIWLPEWAKRKSIAAKRVRKAVSWMRKPCAFIDRHSRARLRFLTQGLMRWVTLLICVILPMSWPPLEVLPFFSSFGALVIALLSFGLFTRDGIYVLAGYLVVGLGVAAAVITLF